MGAVQAFDAGFTAQLSVMPPGARVAPNSKLDPADAGKAPALRGYDGYYHGYNWLNSRPGREAVEGWEREGSNIGFLASAYPAIDIDITNEAISRAVEEAVIAAVGPCLVRVGQAPKTLLIFRSEEPLRSFDMHYEKWSELLGAADKQLIQFLGRGRQYVMFGNHPRTMQPYQIHDPAHAMVLGPAALPALTPERVVEVFDIINGVMEQFGFSTTSNAEARLHGGDVDQADLRAPTMSDLVALVGRMPNSIPDRDEYVSIGYAIKAASQEDPELGFEAFMDWCQRWDQGSNDPAVVRRDWDKMVPPYRMGYDFLLHKAGLLGADVSDFRFGAGDPRPVEATGETFEVEGDAEVQASQAALQGASTDADAELSDRWLAKQFVYLYGHDYMLPIGGETSYVYKWTGLHWERTPKGHLQTQIGWYLASQVARARRNHENPKEAAAAAMRLGSTKTIQAVHSQVITSPSLVVEMGQLDADPDLLDTPDGPLHLPTGTVLAPDKRYLLTKQTEVSMDPSGYCPRWQKFIEEVTRGDTQLAFYLQCLAGYALTGHTREQVFPFFIGAGGNGKSVFLNILHDILGPNAVSAPVELFQLSRFGGNTEYQLARIHGARLVTTSETKAGGLWDEQRVKQVTGEDRISARHIYGKQFEFTASCTLIVAGNHAPDLEEVTDAMTRRIRVVPWDFQPKNVDLHLEDKLRAELPGIFAWCVAGAMAWYQHGLPRCPTVADVTKSYLADQDVIGMWLADAMTVTGCSDDFISNRELYDSFATWCRLNGTRPTGQQAFSKRAVGELRKRGLLRSRLGHARGWKKAKLAPVENAPSNVVEFPAVAQPPSRR